MVALTDQAPLWTELSSTAAWHADLHQALQKLAGHWQGLEAGFHVFLLDDARLTLTLCVGERLKLLREQAFVADTVLLDTTPSRQKQPWDLWQSKALARLCRPGTGLVAKSSTPEHQQSLHQCGFRFEADHQAGAYAPHWTVKRSRDSWAADANAKVQEKRSCAVVGAGLAGASVAAALARRGWAVRVLDTAPAPAQGASGLPVGLMVPHLSKDDGPRSRLSRRGIHLTHQFAHALLEAGQDWKASGVMQHQPETPEFALWHETAAWVKPAALVNAWLARQGVEFMGQASVASIVGVDEYNKNPDHKADQSGRWCLLDANGSLLAQADHVVLAAAHHTSALRTLAQAGTQALVGETLPLLQGLHGQVSWSRQRPALKGVLPEYPVNGLGSLVAHIPGEGGTCWFAGATYEATAAVQTSVAEQHQSNLMRLRHLLPACASHLEEDFNSDRIQAWAQTRCVTPDRLPAVGPLSPSGHPGIWVSIGMGSRGLSFAALCAELLAARMDGGPLPIEASLARSLDSLRFATNACRQTI
ncbi:MAG: hypothetical protein RLZZ591_1391 [Pseudomonadota bacterium]